MKSIRLLAKQRAVSASKGNLRCNMRVSLALLAGVTISAATAHAQNTGSVFGTVQDKTGAVVSGATITIVDSVHGVTRTTTSSGSGEFQITTLPVGDYILTVAAKTFQTEVITDLKLDADQNIKEVVKLTSGAATDTVTVVDDSGSAIDAKSATLGTLIDQKMIEDMHDRRTQRRRALGPAARRR